jgi:hypothetical protein
VANLKKTRKPYASLVLKILTKKIRKTRKPESINEYHFVEASSIGTKVFRQEFLNVVKKWMIVPGTIIMLGLLTQLGRQGTAWYAVSG